MVEDKLGPEVILPKVCLATLANWRGQYSGLDTFGVCQDAEHFQKYPYDVSYQYNSRGFRDQEWPESLDQLKSAVWCIGDSFTLGLGQPYDHIWPQVLQRRSGMRCINISMDGASNDWIARQATTILQAIQPKYMVIMWSYLHRRENYLKGGDRERRLHYDYTSYQDDLTNFNSNLTRVLSCQETTKFSFCTIPRAFVDPMRAVFDLWQAIADPTWGSAPLTDQQMARLPEHVIGEMKGKLGSWEWYQQLRNYHNSFAATLPDHAELLAWPDRVFEVQQMDLARDGHHFDIKTSQSLVDRLVQDLELA